MNATRMSGARQPAAHVEEFRPSRLSHCLPKKKIATNLRSASGCWNAWSRPGNFESRRRVLQVACRWRPQAVPPWIAPGRRASAATPAADTELHEAADAYHAMGWRTIVVSGKEAVAPWKRPWSLANVHKRIDNPGATGNVLLGRASGGLVAGILISLKLQAMNELEASLY